MKMVKELLGEKASDIWSIGPDKSVYDAIALMAEKNIGALIVDEGSGLVGVFSERDYARKVILEGHSAYDTKVADIMSSNVAYVEPTQTVDDCMALMTQKHIRHLPVIDSDGELQGVVSIGDLVKSVIAEQEFIIEQMEHYISGRP